MTTLYDKQMLWRSSSIKKVEEEQKRLTNREAEECTFVPKINKKKSMHSKKLLSVPTGVDPSDFREDSGLDESEGTAGEDGDDEQGNGAVETSLSMVEAMKSHVSRQQYARQQIEDAKRKLVGPEPKHHDRVTKPLPFKLSTGNKKKPEVSEIHNRAASKDDIKNRAPRSRRSPNRERTKVGHLSKKLLDNTHEDGTESHDKFKHLLKPENVVQQVEMGAWERERMSLISIIESQRNEIQQREQAQREAAKIADKFAVAVLSFEERLVAVETKSQQQLSELQKELKQQNDNFQQLRELIHRYSRHQHHHKETPDS